MELLELICLSLFSKGVEGWTDIKFAFLESAWVHKDTTLTHTHTEREIERGRQTARNTEWES